ncbi:MAG: MarR family transcriptional regulator [Acetatifactor sp.]|nr:MarR family transcriptional regulator [Acetatifactor sp.]
MDDAYKKINYILVRLVNEIWELEAKAIITDEFKDLTNNDMHVIEAIGLEGGRNMSTVAKKLDITVSSLTTAVNHLVKKQYVERSRSEEDRRVVFLSLTEKGTAAYKHHEEYHRQMTEAVLEKLDAEDMPVLLKVLDAVNDFFRGYGKQMTEGKQNVGAAGEK